MRGNELSVDITRAERGRERKINEAIKERLREFQRGDYYEKTKLENKGRQEFPADAPKPTESQSGPNHRRPRAAAP